MHRRRLGPTSRQTCSPSPQRQVCVAWRRCEAPRHFRLKGRARPRAESPRTTGDGTRAKRRCSNPSVGIAGHGGVPGLFGGLDESVTPSLRGVRSVREPWSRSRGTCRCHPCRRVTESWTEPAHRHHGLNDRPWDCSQPSLSTALRGLNEAPDRLWLLPSWWAGHTPTAHQRSPHPRMRHSDTGNPVR